MMHMRGSRFWCVLFAALCALAAGALLCAPRAEVLCVRDAQGRLLLSAPLPEGREFGIRFIHSVAKSPVEEWFSARSGVIALNRTVYQDFGAGLPHEAGAGQRMTFHDGRIEISGYSLLLPRMDVRVGRVAQHVLLLPQAEPQGGPPQDAEQYRVLPLSALGPPGSALTFSLEKASLWSWRNLL